MRNGVMALVAVSIVASFVGIVRAQGVGPTKPTIYVGLCDACSSAAETRTTCFAFTIGIRLATHCR